MDVNIPGEYGQTPLHYCAIKNSLEAAKKLVSSSLYITGKSCDPFDPPTAATGMAVCIVNGNGGVVAEDMRQLWGSGASVH